MDDFAKRYNESNASVLILIGPPGTAKSTFLKQLLKASEESALITYSEDLLQQDLLFSHFFDSPEKYLIIEDADTYISSRSKDGNKTMNMLLNMTDGITSNPNKKIIFTTNLPNLDSVDEALLRPKRCFDILEFGKLTISEATELANDLGIKEPITKELTIAQLMEIKESKKAEKLADKTSKLCRNAGFI